MDTLNDLYAWAYNHIAHNDMAAAGILMVAASSLLFYGRALPNRAMALLKRRVLIDIEVLDRDRSYRWLSAWLAENSPLIKRTRLLSVDTRDADDPEASVGPGLPQPTRSGACREEAGTPQHRHNVRLIPAPGRHLLRYDGHWLLFTRDRSDKPGQGGGDGGMVLDFRESWTIIGLRRSRGAVIRLIEEAGELANPPHKPMVNILHVNGTAGSCYWEECARVLPRPIASVPLPDGQEQSLLDDARQFLKRRAWYEQRGVPWRRGYLLAGIPGSGKTSLIRALASELGMGIAVLSLGGDRMTDQDLARLINGCSRCNVLVIEDIDALWRGREKQDAGGCLTFSGLLNAIDGAGSGDGRILVMSTNHPDQLDPALIRAGRVDLRVDLGAATVGQTARLFNRWHPDASTAQGLAFARGMVDRGGVSMAEVQAVLIEAGDDADLAVALAVGPSLDGEAGTGLGAQVFGEGCVA